MQNLINLALVNIAFYFCHQNIKNVLVMQFEMSLTNPPPPAPYNFFYFLMAPNVIKMVEVAGTP